MIAKREEFINYFVVVFILSGAVVRSEWNTLVLCKIKLIIK